MDYNLDSQADMGFKTSVAKGFELIVHRATKICLYPEIIYNLYIKLFDYEKYYTNVQNLPKHIIEKKKNELIQKFKNKIKTDTDVYDGEKKCFQGLVETLMDSNEAGLGLSDEDIKSHVITIVAGGFETTSLTVSYCLLLLAIYPDIQDRVYDEIYTILGDSDEPITIEQTTSLVYLKQVIHETLRLFPIAPVMLRQLQDDVTIITGNHTLPKGTICCITPLITHRNPELYPNPKSFNPDNFNADNVASRHKYSFIAFSGGPRSCIGMKYSLVLMTLLISYVLRNFSVHTDMKLSDIKLKLGMSLHNTVGFPITIQSRKQ
ncbi:Cytochrome P450, E-class, group I,Cytochrome P450,Cytochrome P450, conserved site [Cinara cedri]|uniref:Cytochrome P450, E-class, group I,Cytochrome P450,Cytochrome P450, conserved site n=1 Tax=Cinara cedri TaxID=506608 RepID=A0A5E4MN34_9HEMI|nr:Cytochrome P450, E-class, group I,Cytochrome P450,Cytochrome P450, conserved site [Cinara cedri]